MGLYHNEKVRNMPMKSRVYFQIHKYFGRSKNSKKNRKE